MCFHVGYLRRRNTGIFQRLAHEFHLRITAGYCQTFALAVMIRGGRAYQSIDAITVRSCTVQSLQYNQACALTPDITIGGCIERPGTPGR